MKFDPSIVLSYFQSPLGPMTLGATHTGLAGVWFDGQRHLPPELESAPSWSIDKNHPVLIKTAAQLTHYFAGQRTAFDVPLDLSSGTAFQQAVWQALLAIPSGHTMSYGSISTVISAL